MNNRAGTTVHHTHHETMHSMNHYNTNDNLQDGDDGLYANSSSGNNLGEPNRTKWTAEEDEALRIAVGVSINKRLEMVVFEWLTLKNLIV